MVTFVIMETARMVPEANLMATGVYLFEKTSIISWKN